MSEQKQEALDVELLDAKAIKKLRKNRGDGYIKELVVKPTDALKASLSELMLKKEQAKQQTAENVDLKRAQGVVGDFKAALKGVTGPLDDEIKAVLCIINSRNDK